MRQIALVTLLACLGGSSALAADRPERTDKQFWTEIINRCNSEILNSWEAHGVGLPDDVIWSSVAGVSNGGLSRHGFALEPFETEGVRASLQRRRLWMEWLEGTDHALVWRTYPSEFYSHFFPGFHHGEAGEWAGDEDRRQVSRELLEMLGQHCDTLLATIDRNESAMEQMGQAGEDPESPIAVQRSELSEDQRRRLQDLHAANGMLSIAVYAMRGKAQAFWSAISPSYGAPEAGLVESLRMLEIIDGP